MSKTATANQLYGFASELVSGVIGNLLASTVTAALTALFTYGLIEYTKRSAYQKLRNDEIELDDISIDSTRYLPTTQFNEATGNPYVRQQLTSHPAHDNSATVDLNVIFGSDHIGQKLCAYILRAKELCTNDNPVVFAHLQKVIPAEEYPMVQKLLWKNLVRYCSGLLNPLGSFLASEEMDVHQRKIWPVLIFEPSAEKKHLRFVMLPPEQLDINTLPLPADVIPELPHQIKRIISLHAVANVLALPENGWIKEFSGVRYTTPKVA